MRSTFNALILQSLIFCWVDVDIALFKKYKKNKKNQNLQKKERKERKKKSWGTSLET